MVVLLKNSINAGITSIHTVKLWTQIQHICAKKTLYSLS